MAIIDERHINKHKIAKDYTLEFLEQQKIHLRNIIGHFFEQIQSLKYKIDFLSDLEKIKMNEINQKKK